MVEHAIAKRQAKRADWIVANDVSGDVMGGRNNRVHLITGEGVEDWPEAQGRSRAPSDRANCRSPRLSRRPCSAGPAGILIFRHSSFSPSNR